MDRKRRMVCSAVGSIFLVSLGGCTGQYELPWKRNKLGILVANDTGSAHTFDLSITQSETEVFKTTVTLKALQHTYTERPITIPEFGQEYRVTVVVDESTQYSDTVLVKAGDDTITLSFDGTGVMVESAVEN